MFLQRDQPVAPESLQQAVHMHARQPERVREIRLRQRQVVLAVRGLADRSQTIQSFAQEMRRAFEARANADTEHPFAGRRLFGELRTLQGVRDTGMSAKQVEVDRTRDLGDPAGGEGLDRVVERVAMDGTAVAEIPPGLDRQGSGGGRTGGAFSGRRAWRRR